MKIRPPERVLVAGGTGGVGREIVRRLKQLGVPTRVLTRDRRRASRFGKIDLVEGDALVEPDCVRAVEGCDAVICAVGERRMPRGRAVVDGEGIINLADAALKGGARRFVLVSSLGVGETWSCLPFFVKWAFQVFNLVPVLEEKARSESHLKSLGLDWTILRPALLTNFRMRGEPLVVEAGLAGGTTTRQAAADVAVRCLCSPNTVGTVLIVVDHCMRFTLRGQGPFFPDTPWERWQTRKGASA